MQDEPLLEMNPVDAQARGISRTATWCRMQERPRRRARCVSFLTEGIVPGAVATQSGWTPDYSIEGNYQMLTHLTPSTPPKKFISA